MIDIKKLRDNPESVKQALRKRGYDLDVTLFSQLDSARKSLQVDVENLQAERKKLSAKFGKLKSSGEPTDELKKIIDNKNDELSTKDVELQEIMTQLDSLMLDMPNIPDDSVPEGKDESENVVINEHGKILSANELDHLEIADEIDIDIAGTKVATFDAAGLAIETGGVGVRHNSTVAATASIASGETLGLFGTVTFTGVVTVAGEMVVV